MISNLGEGHGKALSTEKPPVRISLNDIHYPPHNQSDTLDGGYKPTASGESEWPGLRESTHMMIITQTHGKGQSPMP